MISCPLTAAFRREKRSEGMYIYGVLQPQFFPLLKCKFYKVLYNFKYVEPDHPEALTPCHQQVRNVISGV